MGCYSNTEMILGISVYFRLNPPIYKIGSLNFFEASADLLVAINVIACKFWTINNRMHIFNCSGVGWLVLSLPLNWNSSAAYQRNSLSYTVIYDFGFLYLQIKWLHLKVTSFSNHACIFHARSISIIVPLCNS